MSHTIKIPPELAKLYAGTQYAGVIKTLADQAALIMTPKPDFIPEERNAPRNPDLST